MQRTCLCGVSVSVSNLACIVPTIAELCEFNFERLIAGQCVSCHVVFKGASDWSSVEKPRYASKGVGDHLAGDFCSYIHFHCHFRTSDFHIRYRSCRNLKMIQYRVDKLLKQSYARQYYITRSIYYITAFTGQRSFLFRAVKLWNNLPEHLKCIDTLHNFKTSVRTILYMINFTKIVSHPPPPFFSISHLSLYLIPKSPFGRYQ